LQSLFPLRRESVRDRPGIGERADPACQETPIATPNLLGITQVLAAANIGQRPFRLASLRIAETGL
jgi:hypothetical protein